MTAEAYPTDSNAVQNPELWREIEDVLPAQQVHGTVSVHGSKTEYTAEIPLDLQSTELTAWINGFGAFKKTMRGISRETSRQGFATVRYRPIRRSVRSPGETWQDATALHVDTLDAVVNHLADNPELGNTQQGRHLNFGRVALAPHSYGGATANRYALAHPENISKIIGIETVGQEDPRLLRFLGRLPGFAVGELLPFIFHHGPDFKLHDGKKAVEYMLSAPIQTLGEVRACILADIRTDYYELRENNIGTALLTGTQDTLIPLGPIEKVAAHMVDYYERVEGNHLGPQQDPAVFADAVVRASKTLDEQRKPKLSVVGD